MLYNLILDDSRLKVVPSSKEVEKALTYTHKTIEKQGFGSKVVRRQRHIFRKLEHEGVHILETYQGVWMRVADVLRAAGHEVRVTDDRDKFPSPRLDLMYGFRGTQEALTREMLAFNCSGIMSAVTRFGKSTCLLNVMRAFPDLCTVLILPGADLMEQAVRELKHALPARHIVQIGGGSGKRIASEDLTVCSMDSMHLLDHGRVRLVLVDEPHELPTDSRVPEFLKLERARKYGFGGSVTGRFDGRDLVTEALIGPVLVEKTYVQAVAEGAVCPLHIIMLRVPVRPQHFYNRDQAYKALLWQNPERLADIRHISDVVLAPDAQTILFINNEKQGNAVYESLDGERRLAMAKVLTSKERKAMTAGMRMSEIKRCISSEIFSTGVTFSDLAAVINISGGGGSVSCVQKPGRLLEMRPGKKCGVMFEFLFTAAPPTPGQKQQWGPWRSLVSDSDARLAVYRDRGYALHFADTLAEVGEIYRKHCT